MKSHALPNRTVLSLALLILTIPAFARPITITGRVLGHDGKPLPAAGIIIVESSVARAMMDPSKAAEHPAFATVANDGSFSVAVERPGFYMVMAHGVNHQSMGIGHPLLLIDDSDVVL